MHFKIFLSLLSVSVIRIFLEDNCNVFMIKASNLLLSIDLDRQICRNHHRPWRALLQSAMGNQVRDFVELLIG